MPAQAVQSNPILAATEAANAGNVVPSNPAQLPSYSKGVALPVTPTAPARVSPSTADLVASVIDSGNVAKAASLKMVQDMTAMSVSSEDAQKKLATANRTIALTKAKAELETQSARRKLATEADTLQLLTELAVEQTANIRNASKQRADVIRNDNVTLEKDGPLAAIIASFSKKGEIAQAERADKTVAATGAMIKTVDESTSASARVIATTAEVVTQATVDAIDTQMQATATISRNARAAALSQTNAKTVTANFSLTLAQVDAINKLNAEQRLANNAKVTSAKVRAEEQTNEEIARIVNIARKEVGANAITAEQVAGHKALGGQGWVDLERDYSTGGKLLAKDPMKELSVGNNAYQATKLLLAADDEGLTLNTGRNRAIADASAAVQASITEGERPSDAEISKRWNTAFKAKTDADRKLIPAGGSSTFSSVPYTVLARSPAVQATALHSKILEPLGWNADPEAGHISTRPMDEQKIADLAKAAMASGTLTLQEATEGLNIIFGYAVEHNNAINQYEQSHLLPQDAYPVRLTTATGIGVLNIGLREEPVNLINPTKTRNYLIKALSVGQASMYRYNIQQRKEAQKDMTAEEALKAIETGGN